MTTTSATFTDLGDGIIHIDAEYMSPGVASVYLIIEGNECAIIETATCHTAPIILSVLNEYGLDEQAVRYIIPTHVHLDHAGGAGTLMELCPKASFVVHPLGARHMIDPTKLIAGATAVYGEETFKRLYGELKPIDKARVIEAPDNTELTLAGRTLRFYDTPGHARHHFCIHDLRSNTIFSGDTFGISYPALSTPSGPLLFATTTPVQFDPDALHASINRLLSLKPHAFNLTHFGRITPTDDVVAQLRHSIDRYLEIAEKHRQLAENRAETIHQEITAYLLGEYRRLGGTEPDDKVKKLVALDSQLNAQGVDFWLSKQG
ncbi:MAG: MBL fold metallo-hydrolase [Proteobacteria bacterium]|nr:MAG: MBL fold metallo-hydrolase [Pseudomonadota bacterium]